MDEAFNKQKAAKKLDYQMALDDQVGLIMEKIKNCKSR